MDWQAVTYAPCGARAPVTACAYCGRNNDPSAQFCMDCGKPMGKSGRLRAAAAPGGGTRGDRKSTRLNSSHLVISYAVFCLKKKKKKNSAYDYTRKTHSD